ncbi:MAG TPA: redoxin domain-containing protein [Candidatus Tumulicola sp.]|nr:redoxin domain-containing protein [Candidatus Tumulicola sp.]
MRQIALILAALALSACASQARSAQAMGPGITLQRVLSESDWLNGRPAAADVRGKVVLLDFYTFLCYNCKNTEPNLRALYKQHSRNDLVILSVHSPETEYEKVRKNLIESFSEQGVVWPVLVDNDRSVFDAYGVTAWPTQMIFDRHGRLVQTVVGDSQDATVNSALKNALGR